MTDKEKKQAESILEDLLHFKDDKEMLNATVMLYIVDMQYSRAAISKAVGDLKKEHGIDVYTNITEDEK